MTIALSEAFREVCVDAGVDLFDGGTLEIRSGSAPGPNAADSGTLLVSIPLPTPAFGNAGASTAGQADKAGTWEDSSADASGTAGHFRFKQSGDGGGADATQERIEGSVTGSGGGGDIELDNTSINSGQSVEVTAFNVSMAES